MKMFIANIILAITWGALTGEITLLNLAFGFVIGYFVLLLARGVTGRTRYFQKVWYVTSFFIYFIKELIVASLRVAYDIMTPHHYNKPGIVALPLDADMSDIEITLLANVISLTPGTLSLDVSEDRRTLFVHAMFIDDPDELRDEINRGLKRRLMEVLR